MTDAVVLDVRASDARVGDARTLDGSTLSELCSPSAVVELGDPVDGYVTYRGDNSAAPVSSGHRFSCGSGDRV